MTDNGDWKSHIVKHEFEGYFLGKYLVAGIVAEENKFCSLTRNSWLRNKELCLGVDNSISSKALCKGLIKER
jgi:hypothetical protein